MVRHSTPVAGHLLYRSIGAVPDINQSDLQDQRQCAALGVALAVERLLGLNGSTPVGSGLYLSEVPTDPAYFVWRMQEFGATFEARDDEMPVASPRTHDILY